MFVGASRLTLLGLLTLLLSLLAGPFAAASPAEPPAGPAAPAQLARVYLPVIVTHAGATPPSPAPGPSPRGGLFLNTASWNYNATIAVDRAGGLHAAYFATGETPDGVRPAYYAYCPAQPAGACLQRAGWRQVALAEGADDVQIALTPAGQPRVLISPEPDGRGAPIRYAACDSQCADPARWAVATVATTAVIGVGNSYATAQSFALDHLGRPRFIYTDDRAGMDHAGTFFAACDANCTQPEAWGEGQIDQDRIDGPVLRFDASGRPHLLGRVSGDNGGALFYATYGDEAVATSLAKLPHPLVLAFDADDAGRAGAHRLASLLDARQRPPV
ncbi:MAG TPA: hypothetical protein PKD53_33805, partial [Chloroflexaceae bacterium]|nr:hypothetical protein [Chloroflexaceae bacterium]